MKPETWKGKDSAVRTSFVARQEGRVEGKEERAMLRELVNGLWMVLRDERGVETLEWILIGALITAVGLVVYPGTLQGALVGAVTAVGNTITGAV